MLTSKELELIQKTLKKSIRASLNRLNCDYDKIKELVEVIGKLDNLRRNTWNHEKFVTYEEIANEVFSEINDKSKELYVDDLPF
jgi:hypothetical protein